MKEIDTNGFWRIRNNPLSKEGVFPYLGRQISSDLEPDKIYWVYRPMSEISNPETVESFNAAPLIDEHEMIGEGWTKYDDRPAGGVVYNTQARDGKLYGDIRIYSEKLKDEIESGKKELSMGYECNYEPEKGVFEGKQYDFVQRNLRGNHIALVNRGRMGSDVRVYDHFTFDTLEGIGEFEMEAMDKEWNEADHPRDDKGRFTNGSQGKTWNSERNIYPVKEYKDFLEDINNAQSLGVSAVTYNDADETTVKKWVEQAKKEGYGENIIDVQGNKVMFGKISENKGNSESNKIKFYGEEIDVSKADENQLKEILEEVEKMNEGSDTPKIIRKELAKRNSKKTGDEKIPSIDGSPKESGVDSSFNIKGEDTLEKVDKRKGISEVEAMLYEAKKDPAKLTDELIKTILQKMENNSYEASEKTKADDEDIKEEEKSEDEVKSCKDGCKTKDECGSKEDKAKDESGVAKENAEGEAPTKEKDEGKKEDKKAEDAMIAVADALPEILQSLNEIKASLAQKQSATDSAPITYGLDEETPAYSKNEDKVLKKYLGEM